MPPAANVLATVELFRFTNLECRYGARDVFENVSGVLNSGERVALVGANGAGKSSLLRQLANVDPVRGGTIVRAKGTRFGYLAQSMADESDLCLDQLVTAALDRVPDADWAQQNKRLRAMLDAFGFDRDDYARPLREFSGGQRAKAGLAHLLIDDPDYLILDEPTNHLDVATVRWLESYIAADRRAYLIVSHDRYFLDRVATRIWELERGRLHVYSPATPAYSGFLKQREARLEKERETYRRFMEERESRRAGIAGLRTTHTSSDYSQVRSREKQLARIENAAADLEPPAPEPPRIKIALGTNRRPSGGFALEVRNLAKAFAQPLFEQLSFDVQQGARLAVAGANGAGKSTLLNILAGEVTADSGSVRFNPAIRWAYFTQNASDELDLGTTAVEAVLAAAPISAERARGLLGRMRISGDAADKPVAAFSGGERRRIMLARLMARECDLLLLDEPTNDLDIASREALEDVLDEFDGTLIVVSHDRYLLDRLCRRVLWIDDGDWGIVEGGYRAYESEMASRERSPREAQPGPTPSNSRLTPLKRRSLLEAKIARLEREIDRLDTRRNEIAQLFTTVEIYDDRARVAALKSEAATLEDATAQALVAWESASHELHALER